MTILEEAQQLVGGDRQQDYGNASESFTRIARLWSAYKGVEISPKDVGMMMILMKVSRSVGSNKRDTLVDIAGYAQCIHTISEGPIAKAPPKQQREGAVTPGHRVGCECSVCAAREHGEYCFKCGQNQPIANGRCTVCGT